MPVNISRRLNNLEKKIYMDIVQNPIYSYDVPPQDTRPSQEIIEEWKKSGKVKDYKAVYIMPQFEHDEDDDVKDVPGAVYRTGRIFIFIPR
jgi:hypothetical protein